MYQKIKEKLIGYKKEFVLGIGFVVVFLAGYGTGAGERAYLTNIQPDQNQIKYNSNQHKTPVIEGKTDPDTPLGPVSGKGTCKIKGTSSRIYHIPGGAFYNRVTAPAACFNTEAEAQAAGYRKSSR